jgi:hypothetical protein
MTGLIAFMFWGGAIFSVAAAIAFVADVLDRRDRNRRRDQRRAKVRVAAWQEWTR